MADIYKVISFNPKRWTKHRRDFRSEDEARNWASENVPDKYGCGFMVLPKEEATTDNIRFQLFG